MRTVLKPIRRGRQSKAGDCLRRRCKLGWRIRLSGSGGREAREEDGMRSSVLGMMAVLVLGAVTGCGSKFTGTLCESCGNGPTPPAGGAVVTSVSPASVAAGGPGFTLTVTGKNFAQGMTVGGIGTTSTTYVSSTEMQAQVPASAIANPGSLTIIAVTSPPPTLNFGVGFTITDAAAPGNSGFTVSNVAIEANDMVWNPTSQQIYLSVSGGSATNANTITALDPVTGQLGISQAAGSEPDKLAISSDGSYLYAGLDSAGSVQRFMLPGLGKDIAISLGSDPTFGPDFAVDVEVAPGSPHTIAVVRGGSSPDVGGVVIYDDAVARTTSASVYPINSIQWNSNASQIYADNSGDTSFDFYVFSVNPSGVQEANEYMGLVGGQLHYESTTGFVYSDQGKAIDPSTGSTVGTFPLEAVDGGYTFFGVMVPDGTLNVAYYLGQGDSEQGTQNYTLEAFDLTHFTLLGAISIPNVVGTPVKLIRWGTNGLAFLTKTIDTTNGTAAPAQGDGVYLISGAFVTNPAAQGRKSAFTAH